MIRITGGSLSGRRIPVPRGKGIRPMPERVRLAVSNSLTPFIQGAHVLEIFAGTGALGIEMVSRGARKCTFVELEGKHVKFIKNAARELGISGLIDVRKGDAFDFPRTGEKFDIIFMGPPYVIFRDDEGRARFNLLLAEILKNNTNEGAIVGVQVPKTFDPAPEGFKAARVKKYNENKVVYYQLPE